MLKIRGTQQEIDEFVNKNKIDNLSETIVEVVEMGLITDEEIDAFGVFTEEQKEIIKKAYATYEKGFFRNPMCALY